MMIDGLNMKEREVMFAVAVIVLAAFAAGMAFQPQSTSQESEVLTWDNQITIQHNGEVIAQFHNVLTDQGANFIRDKISASNSTAGVFSGDNTQNASFVAVGNGTAPSKSTVQLADEVANDGLQRSQGTTKTYGPGNFSVEVSFTANGGDIGVVNTTSLNWNSSGPSIISGGAFGTEANILDGDTLTVTHNISIS